MEDCINILIKQRNDAYDKKELYNRLFYEQDDIIENLNKVLYKVCDHKWDIEEYIKYEGFTTKCSKCGLVKR